MALRDEQEGKEPTRQTVTNSKMFSNYRGQRRMQHRLSMVSVDNSYLALPWGSCGTLDQVHAGDIDLCPEYQRGSTLHQ